MKKNPFIISSIALFLMLFVFSCKKTDEQPTPTATSKAIKQTQKDKSSDNSELLHQLVVNEHFRTIYQSKREFDNLRIEKIRSLQGEDKIAFTNLLASFDSNTPIEQILSAFDITKAQYDAIMERIAQNYIHLFNTLPALGGLSESAYTDLIAAGDGMLNNDFPVLYSGPCETERDNCIAKEKADHDASVNRIMGMPNVSNEKKKEMLIKVGDLYAGAVRTCEINYQLCRG